MLAEPPASSSDLVPYILAAGESRNVDAKGPMEWDGAQQSASLAKDIMALSNCRDGGVLVIGKKEESPGKFNLLGVSEEQAAGFDTTKVATWVNNHCYPAVQVVCHRVTHEGKIFLVITVKEFEEIPTICTRAYQLEGSREFVLRSGTVYVRTANAESAPLSNGDQLRQLIGLATVKRGDQMLAMFRSLLKGEPLVRPQNGKKPYAQEVADLLAHFGENLGDTAKKGTWTFAFYPDPYVERRWQREELRAILKEDNVEVTGRRFPYEARDWYFLEKGIASNFAGERLFALNTSGLFLCQCDFYLENHNPFRDPWRSTPPKTDLPAGTWMDFQLNLYLIIEFFWFASRFCHRLQPGETLTCELEASGLAGRRLVSSNPNIWMLPEYLCRASRWRYPKTLKVEVMMSDWQRECVEALYDFFMLFGDEPIKRETLAKWVEKFKSRDI